MLAGFLAAHLTLAMAFAEVHRVDSVAVLNARLANARPGDVLVVAAGRYSVEAPRSSTTAATTG